MRYGACMAFLCKLALDRFEMSEHISLDIVKEVIPCALGFLGFATVSCVTKLFVELKVLIRFLLLDKRAQLRLVLGNQSNAFANDAKEKVVLLISFGE